MVATWKVKTDLPQEIVDLDLCIENDKADFNQRKIGTNNHGSKEGYVDMDRFGTGGKEKNQNQNQNQYEMMQEKNELKTTNLGCTFDQRNLEIVNA